MKKLLKAQKHELTEYHIYKNLSKIEKNPKNKKAVEKIAKKELDHHNLFKGLTKKKVEPSYFKIKLFFYIAKLLGINFGLRLLEAEHKGHKKIFNKVLKDHPSLSKKFIKSEKEEKEFLDLLDKTKLNYSGSVVLGLNDALVEITGALAGFTLAFSNGNLIAVAGLITGIAAALSMGGSEYLSTKEEESGKNALKASFYNGFTYIMTVGALVMPYFLFQNQFIALGVTISIAIIIILVFNFYLAVAKNLSFKKKFLNMMGIFITVTILNFLIGLFVKHFLNIQI